MSPQGEDRQKAYQVNVVDLLETCVRLAESRIKAKVVMGKTWVLKLLR